MSAKVKHMVELKHVCQNYLLDNCDIKNERVKELLVLIKQKLNEICNHQFEYDTIEVGETTHTICYCVLCNEPPCSKKT